MNLSNTGGGGRGSDKGSIGEFRSFPCRARRAILKHETHALSWFVVDSCAVGDVILHGKKQYWQRGAGYHYHHGLRA
eukprot:54125-Eustigmatos_ZCMA.PRE.1